MGTSVTQTGITFNDGTSQTTAANPYFGGRATVFDTGAIFTASKATTVMTVTAVTKGTLFVGQTVYYNNTSMTITSLGTGTGGTGTYNVSVSGTVSSRPWGGSGPSSGASATFTIPTGITAVKVTVVGGGGAGGNSGTSTYSSGGGGGGSAVKYLTGLSPGSTLIAVCGGAAGTSTVSSGTQTISPISATGGSPGSAIALNSGFASGGAGGLGSGGDINSYGQRGEAAMTLSFGCLGSSGVVGTGGASILAGGGLQSGNVNATPPLYGGAGGGGAASASACTTRFGGMGAPGMIIFEY